MVMYKGTDYKHHFLYKGQRKKQRAVHIVHIVYNYALWRENEVCNHMCIGSS